VTRPCGHGARFPSTRDMLGAIFERFTDHARRVLHLAQEEALHFRHTWIGTEHILLGLLAEGNGVSAKALEELDLTLEGVRFQVEEAIGISGTAPSGSPPFTTRAKKVLELSLREALHLGHNYIGTEHLVLGLVREGEGVAAQILIRQCGDLEVVRQEVLSLLEIDPIEEEACVENAGRGRRRRGLLGGVGRGYASARFARGGARPEVHVVRCSFCGRQPPDSGRLVRGGDAYICEHCINDWHGKLETSAEEPTNTVAELYQPDNEAEDGGDDTGLEDPTE
jgi:hypothetical protein